MPRHLRWFAALAVAALALGCASKKRVVDPGFSTPEGTFSSDLELITFLSQPTYKILMEDRGSIGAVDITPDLRITDLIALDASGSPVITPIFSQPPGTVRGLVLNRSAAEGVEVFRSESSGGMRSLFDFALQPVRRWIDGLTEIYEFADTDPNRPSAAAYVVRGLIGGVAGPNSPLSRASRPVSVSLANIRYTANRNGTIPRDDGGTPAPAESTFMMRWDPVPLAARYLIQVFEYQPRARDLRQQLETGVPAPVLTEEARDIFVATVPGTTTLYKLGATVPGGRIYTYRTPRMRAEYFVRIAALDANSQMIGLTIGPTITQFSDLLQISDVRDYFANFTDPEVAAFSSPHYLFYTRGAVRVSPGEIRIE